VRALGLLADAHLVATDRTALPATASTALDVGFVEIDRFIGRDGLDRRDIGLPAPAALLALPATAVAVTTLPAAALVLAATTLAAAAAAAPAATFSAAPASPVGAASLALAATGRRWTGRGSAVADLRFLWGQRPLSGFPGLRSALDVAIWQLGLAVLSL